MKRCLGEGLYVQYLYSEDVALLTGLEKRIVSTMYLLGQTQQNRIHRLSRSETQNLDQAWNPLRNLQAHLFEGS